MCSSPSGPELVRGSYLEAGCIAPVGAYATVTDGKLVLAGAVIAVGGSLVTDPDSYRLLLDKGQTGLSVAFDLPTQTGYDPDHPLARGEVGTVYLKAPGPAASTEVGPVLARVMPAARSRRSQPRS